MMFRSSTATEPFTGSVPSLFAAWATREPARTAIVTHEGSLSYGELADRVGRVAAALLDLGVERGGRVVVQLPPGLDQLTAVLGVMFAGAAYVPIDVGEPEQRARLMLEDADPQVCIVGDESWLSDGVPVSGLLAHPTAIGPQPVEATDPIYILYTSGTTGRPKGVVLPHEGIANLIEALVERAELEDVERVLYRTRFTFDASVPELLLPLATGRTTVVPDDVRDVTSLLGAIVEHEVDMVTMVPSLAWSLMGSVSDLSALSGVTRWLSVGEALPARTAKRLLEVAGPGLRLFNMYGPTEASVFLSGTEVTAADVPTGLEQVSLGTVLAGYAVEIRDPATFEPCPPGVEGEICVSGIGVALGYRNQGNGNGTFLPHPDTGERMYRTGDLGTLDADGRLGYGGRKDDQVKVRGHRIELGEVDAQLGDCVGVESAASAILEQPDHNILVAALVRSDDDSDPATFLARVRAEAQTRLPEQALPTHLAVVTEFPLNRNGKLDRRTLAIMVQASIADRLDGDTVAATEQEELLASAIAEALGNRANLPLDVPVSELGLDSLGAILTRGALMRAGWELGIADLLGRGSIRDLAQRMAPAATLTPQPQSRMQSGSRLLPTTRMQQSILAATEKDESRTAYIVQQIHRVDPTRFDQNRLRTAFQQLVDGHAALRTTVGVDASGEHIQVIHDDVEATVVVEQFVDGPHLDGLLRTDRETPFDLSRAPLARLYWFTPAGHEADACLVLTYHHLILDGYSQNLILEELLGLHDDTLEPTLDAASEQANHAVLMRELAEDPVGAAHYEELLQGFDDSHGAAVFSSPVPDGSPIGSTHLVTSRATRERAMHLASRAGTTLSSVIETAWSVVLQQFSGLHDVAYGKIVTRRSSTVGEALSAAGLFISSVPARVRADAHTTVNDVLGEVHRQSLLAAVHDAMGLDARIRTLYLFENWNAARARIAAEGLRRDEASTEQTGMDLTFIASDDGEQLAFHALYAGLRMGRDAVDLLLERVLVILETMAKDPSTPIRRLPVTVDGDRALLDKDAFDGSPSPHGRVETVFDAVVAEHGDHPAVVDGDRTLTYHELDAAADACAALLWDSGVRPKDRVGVVASWGHSSFVVELAVIRVGACYVPVDLDMDRDKLHHIADNVGMDVIVAASGAEAETAKSQLPRVRCVEFSMPVGHERVTFERPQHLSVEDPICILHTSGTTGMPKGVVVPHRAITRLVLDADYARLGHDQVMLRTGAMTFDVTNIELWGAWLNGATLVLVPREDFLDTTRLRAAIERHGITWLWLTASLFNLHAEADPTVWAGLDTVITGGERLSQQHVNRFLDANDTTTLINGYGPTEVTTFATTHTIDRADRLIPIGRPIPRTGAHVVAHGNVVGRMLPGELWLTGDGVTLGYLGDPERTSRSFVPSPAGDGVAYRTGDLARRNVDGTIEYLGRIDDEVKIRGLRIETESVAAALRNLPEVQQAAVLAQGTTTSGLELIGFVTLRDPADPASIRASLFQVLEPVAVPKEIHVVDSLPLTSSGKVDRRALLRGITPASNAAASSPPTGPMSEVQRCYATALRLDAVGPDDDFFALGGDSLKAMRLVNLLRRAGHDIPLSLALTESTPSRLEAALTRTTADTGTASPAPAGVWATAAGAAMAQIVDPDSRSHNIPFGFLVDGHLDVEALQDLVRAIIRRHPMLRTGFAAADPADADPLRLGIGLTQRTAEPNVADRFTVQHAIHTQDGLLTVRASEAILCDWATPFALDEAPLLRASVVSGTDQDLVMFDAHHAVFDGRSLELFADELAGIAHHHDPEAAPTAPSEEGLAERLRAFPRFPAPLDLQLAWQEPDVRLGVQQAPLTQDLLAAMRARCIESSTTEYLLVAAASALLLQRYTLQDDIVLGTPVDTRHSVGADETIGMWVNTAPFPICIDEHATVAQFLEDTKREWTAALEHADVPLPLLTSAIREASGAKSGQLIHAVVTQTNVAAPQQQILGLNATRVGPLTVEPKVDLEVTIQRSADALQLGIEHNRDLVDDASASIMLDQLREVLVQLSSAPLNTLISELTLDPK